MSIALDSLGSEYELCSAVVFLDAGDTVSLWLEHHSSDHNDSAQSLEARVLLCDIVVIPHHVCHCSTCLCTVVSCSSRRAVGSLTLLILSCDAFGWTDGRMDQPEDRHVSSSYSRSASSSNVLTWSSKRLRKPQEDPFKFLSVVFSAHIRTSGHYRVLARIRFPFSLEANAQRVEEQYHWQLVRSSCWSPEHSAIVAEVRL